MNAVVHLGICGGEKHQQMLYHRLDLRDDT